MKLSVIFSIALLLFFVSPVKAATTLVYDNVRSPDVALQGGSDSSVKWHVPDTRNYRVSVYVPIVFGDNYPVRFNDNYLDRLTDM